MSPDPCVRPTENSVLNLTWMDGRIGNYGVLGFTIRDGVLWVHVTEAEVYWVSVANLRSWSWEVPTPKPEQREMPTPQRTRVEL